MDVTNRSLFFLLLYLGGLFMLAYLFQDYFTFLILGGVLVILLNPVNTWVQSKIPNKIVASLLMTVFAIVLILLPMGTLLYSLTGQIESVQNLVRSANFSQVETTINAYLGTSIDFAGIAISGLNELRSVATTQAPAIIGSVANIVVNIFIMFFLMYYGFKEGQRLKDGLLSILPLEERYVESLERRGHDVLYGTLYGQLLVSTIQGALAGLAFWAFSLPGALLWGFVTAIIAFVPLLGTPLVWGPASVVLWLRGDPAVAIAFFVFNAVITMNIDNVLKPKLIGDRAQMHPLLVLLSILGGLNVFGFVGFIVGPVIVSLCILVIEFYIKDFTKADLELAGD